MIKDQFGQLIYTEDDVCDLLMQGQDLSAFEGMFVDRINLEEMAQILDHVPAFVKYDKTCQEDLTVEEYDRRCQSTWFMPDKYKELDIAEYILNLCTTQEQLQRVGEELLLFQEKDLFNLLKYLKYLVDVMQENHIIWGVGRGSSVASYVLYLLGVHRIDSMYYDLDPHEFLR